MQSMIICKILQLSSWGQKNNPFYAGGPNEWHDCHVTHFAERAGEWVFLVCEMSHMTVMPLIPQRIKNRFSKRIA